MRLLIDDGIGNLGVAAGNSSLGRLPLVHRRGVDDES